MEKISIYRKTISRIAIFILLLISTPVFSQYYIDGQDPASVKWRHFKTKNFHIIYPSWYESQALKTANFLETHRDTLIRSMGLIVPRTPLILHPNTSVSNAFATWAPRRMEYFTIAPPNTYPVDWMEQLAIHEYRHISQISQFRLFKLRSWELIFGEQITGLALGLYIPSWLLEGDAVWAETAFSRSGRGRDPEFFTNFKAQTLEKEIYKYNKATLGSFRNFVPNHYEMGYLVVNEATKHYGDKFWQEVLTQTGQRAFRGFTPFSNTLKTKTGLPKRKFYDKMMTDVVSDWKKEEANYNGLEYKQIIPRQNTYTSYQYISPTPLGFIALKNSLNEITHLVLIKENNTEEKICDVGYLSAPAFSYHSQKLLWVEEDVNPRFSNQQFGKIVIYDLKTKQKSTIKTGKNIQSPCFNKDGNEIIAVAIDSLDNYSLVSFDYNRLSSLNYKTISPKLSGISLFTPVVTNDGQIYCTAIINYEKKLCRVTKDSLEVVFNAYNSDIWNLRSGGDIILFNGTSSGKVEIYQFNTKTGFVSRISNSKFASFDAIYSQNNDTLFFTQQNSDGKYPAYMIRSEISEYSFKNDIFTDSLISPAPPIHTLLLAPEKSNISVKTKRYRKIPNALHVHSWAPINLDSETGGLFGFSVLSQDLLSNTLAGLYCHYNPYTGTTKTSASISYAGLYPIIELTGRKYHQIDSIPSMSKKHVYKHFYMDEVSTTIRIPHSKTEGKMNINWELDGGFTHRQFRSNTDTTDYPLGNQNSIFLGGYFAALERMAPRNLRPRTGFLVQNINFASINGKIDFGKNIFFKTIAYLPGLNLNHSLKLSGQFQFSKAGNYIMSSPASDLRGVNEIYLYDLKSLAADYAFPIAYPDFSMGSLWYVKRVHLNIFLEQNFLTNNKNEKRNITAYGVDMISTSHFLRFLFPINFGIRLLNSIDNSTKKANFGAQFIFNVDF